ncbi:MAG TPA: hypothetical protein VN622_11075 [Clostridia bacterium]|nr:hypothetical protein [Clostridia bacterium]
MITITIEKTETLTYTEQQNLVTKEEPSDVVEDKDYGGGKRVIMKREYQVVDLKKAREVKTVLACQNIADESSFDLVKVLKAVNNIES